jgi:hypothetical protein
MASQVLGHQYITGSKGTLGSIADANLHPTGENEQVLTAGSVVPVAKMPVSRTAERQISAGLQFYVLNLAGRCVQVLKMGLSIVAGIESNYH